MAGLPYSERKGLSQTSAVTESFLHFCSLLSQLNKAFLAEESPSVIYCISMQWFREWEAFVRGKDNGKKPGIAGDGQC